MKLETYRIAGPSDPTAAVSIPRYPFAYQLLALTVRFRWGSLVPAAVSGNMLVMDGSGLPVAGWQTDAALLSLGASGDTLLVLFAPIGMAPLAPPVAINTVLCLPVPIMPDLWILPQNQILLQLIGGQAGSPGDDWLDTTLTIARI